MFCNIKKYRFFFLLNFLNGVSLELYNINYLRVDGIQWYRNSFCDEPNLWQNFNFNPA